MTAGTDPKSQPLPGTVLNPRQVRILKFAVVAMGLALLVGFAVLVVAMVYQASRLGESRAPAAAPVPAASITLPLPAGAAVSHLALDGDRLAVHVSGPAGPEILVIDLVSGQVVARIGLAAP